MNKNAKRLTQIDVVLANGTGTTWTRKTDGLDKAALTETNVLMILNVDEQVLMMYGPMMWMSVNSTYEGDSE